MKKKRKKKNGKQHQQLQGIFKLLQNFAIIMRVTGATPLSFSVGYKDICKEWPT